MLILVGAVILAIGFAFFATQNTGSIALNFGVFILTNIPLYLIVLVSFLIGLVLAFFFHMIKDFSSSLTISEEKGRVKKLKDELAETTKKAHQLELENAKLKAQTGEPDDENSI